MTRFVPGLLRRRILGNAALYTVGGIAQRGALLLALPLYTYYLPPSEFGIWSLLATLVVLATSVGDLGARNATVRLYFEHHDDPERIRSFLFSVFVGRVVAALAAFALLTTVGRLLWEVAIGGSVPFFPFAPLIGGAVAAELLVSFHLAVLRVQERARRYVIMVLGQTVLQVGGSLFFIIVLGQGALGPLNGLLLGTGVTAALASILFLAEQRGAASRFRAAHIRESLAFGLPLVPHHVGAWLRSSADRFVLVQFVPLASVGIYHLGYSAGTAIVLLATAVNMAYEPYYYRLKKTHPSPGRIIRSVAGVVGAGLGGICLVGVLFAEEIFALLLAPDYGGAAAVAPLILVSYLLHGVNFQLKKPLFYYRRTALIPWLTLVPGVATIGLCFVFIPIWGMMAAVWLTFANHLAVSLLIGVANRRLSPGQYPLERLAVCLGIVAAGAVWVTYQGVGWIPAAAPGAKLIFLLGYAATAWLLIVREPLLVLRQALPQRAAGAAAEPGSLR